MIRQSLAYSIIALYDNGNGWSKSKIAKCLGISKGTINKYVYFSDQDLVKYYENRQRAKKLDQYHQKIQIVLHDNPKISAKDVRDNLLSQEESLDFSSLRTISRYIEKERASQDFYGKMLIQNELWFRRITQGDVQLTELIEELTGDLPHADIESLYNCVLDRPLRYRNRAISILGYYKGIKVDALAGLLFVSSKFCARTLERYKSRGISSVVSDEKNICRKKDDKKYKKALFKVIHAPPSTYGINRTSWKMDDIYRIMTEDGNPISKGNIRKILQESGYSFKKARKVLTSNDPKYKEKLDTIKRILSNLKQNEKFFSIDEYGPFAVKIQGGKTLVPPGVCKSVPQYQKSKGSLIITSALELSTNQVTHFYSDKKNTDEMIKLLNCLLVNYSSEETIYFSWDAASWHASKKLYKTVEEINSIEYRTEHSCPKVVLAPLPTCAQFLNVIESVFSGMARAIIHNSNYESITDCKKAIDTYFLDRNKRFIENPKKAGNKIWGKERVVPVFDESNNCKDPAYR
jgi:transposase